MLVQNVSSDSYRKTKWKVLPAEGCQVYHRGYQKGQEEDRRNSLEYKKNIQWREIVVIVVRSASTQIG